ncbi:hypothetical protein N665_0794s0017 [Sinapis alba]|nr:hypothetical protein N665_0794s0017 [Sinapis alba]
MITKIIDKNKPKLRKGLWSPDEDEKLIRYMLTNGQGSWSVIARNADLLRCSKSCRLRWINYLRPGLKRGFFSPQEEDLIFHLHSILGNRLKNNNNNTSSESLPNNSNSDSLDPGDQHVDMGGNSNPMVYSYHHHNDMMLDHNPYQQMGNYLFNVNGLGYCGNEILDPTSKRASIQSEWFLPQSVETNVIACTTSNNLNMLEIENPKIGDWDLDGLIDNNSSFTFLDFQV